MMRHTLMLLAGRAILCAASRVTSHSTHSAADFETRTRQSEWPFSTFATAFERLTTPSAWSFSTWPFKSKTCFDVTGPWIHSGEVTTLSSEGRPVKVARTDEVHQCEDKAGWRVLVHGDGRNEVEIKDSGHALRVGGHEVGTGAGITLCDLKSKPEELDYVYTEGLAGCMALVIVGSRTGNHSRGLKDLFFTHARRWSDYAQRPGSVPMDDPLFAAQGFVRTHENLTVFFGSGVHPYTPPHFYSADEAMILSTILGVWVQRSRYHNLAYQASLAYHFAHKSLVPLSGVLETLRLFSMEEEDAGMAKYFSTYPWAPDLNLLRSSAMAKVESEDEHDCSTALHAYAAGDVETLHNIYNFRRSEKKPRKKEKELDSVLAHLFKDMEQKGLLQQEQMRMQIDFDWSIGRHEIQAPRAPSV